MLVGSFRSNKCYVIREVFTTNDYQGEYFSPQGFSNSDDIWALKNSKFVAYHTVHFLRIVKVSFYMVLLHLVKIKVQIFAVPRFNVRTSFIIGNEKSFHEMPNWVELRCVAKMGALFEGVESSRKQ